MVPPRRAQRGRTGRRALPAHALIDLGLGLLPLAACALATAELLALPPQYFADVGGIYVLLAALIVWRLPPDAPPPGLGPANRITLLRATLAVPLTGLILQPALPDHAALWWIAGVAATAIALDGLDGRVARRHGQETAFGARFDMELDAFLMLVLAALVWRTGRVEAWILLIGALRYLFVAAGALWPVLTADLPPSLRRKTVCVVEGVALIACLAPIVPAGLASPVAAGALALLIWSFGVDVHWLIARAPAPVRSHRA